MIARSRRHDGPTGRGERGRGDVQARDTGTRPEHRTLRLAVLLVGWAASGCSWIFVDAPPATASPTEFRACTESAAAPTADTFIAVVGGLAVLVSVVVFVVDAATPSEFQGAGSLVFGLPLLLGGLTLATPFGVSARDGFDDTARCRELLDAETAAAPVPASGGEPSDSP